MKTLGKIFIVLLSTILLFFAVALGYYFTTTSDETLQPKKLLLQNQTLSVYDRCGAEITDAVSLAKKQTLSYKSIPQKTVCAFVDTEDKRFFTHNGFDVRRIAKAVYNNLRSHSYKQGASTISQQLIKNTHLSHEKTLSRKLKECKLTKQSCPK